ncbi:hypothetical protein [Flavobacterium sp.]
MTARYEPQNQPTKETSDSKTSTVGYTDYKSKDNIVSKTKQKIDYIHNNPVKEKLVTQPKDYYFSSVRNYARLENELDIILLDLF